MTRLDTRCVRQDTPRVQRREVPPRERQLHLSVLEPFQEVDCREEIHRQGGQGGLRVGMCVMPCMAIAGYWRLNDKSIVWGRKKLI